MILFAAYYIPEGIAIVSDSRITSVSENDTKQILTDEEQKIFFEK